MPGDGSRRILSESSENPPRIRRDSPSSSAPHQQPSCTAAAHRTTGSRGLHMVPENNRTVGKKCVRGPSEPFYNTVVSILCTTEQCVKGCWSGQLRSDQVRSGQVRSGQIRSGQVRSGQVRSDQVLPPLQVIFTRACLTTFLGHVFLLGFSSLSVQYYHLTQ